MRASRAELIQAWVAWAKEARNNPQEFAQIDDESISDEEWAERSVEALELYLRAVRAENKKAYGNPN